MSWSCAKENSQSKRLFSILSEIQTCIIASGWILFAHGLKKWSPLALINSRREALTSDMHTMRGYFLASSREGFAGAALKLESTVAPLPSPEYFWPLANIFFVSAVVGSALEPERRASAYNCNELRQYNSISTHYSSPQSGQDCVQLGAGPIVHVIPLG